MTIIHELAGRGNWYHPALVPQTRTHIVVRLKDGSEVICRMAKLGYRFMMERLDLEPIEASDVIEWRHY